MKVLFSSLMFICFIAFGYSQKRSAYSSYPTESKVIYGICFTLNGEALAIADNKTIKVYSTNSKELIAEFKGGHSNQILSVDISKDSTLLVSGGKDSVINIWDINSKNVLQSIKCHKGKITSVKISTDGQYLLYGCTGNFAYLFDLKLRKVIMEFTDHTGTVTSVIFSSDGKFLFTASADKAINIYGVEDYRLLTSLKQHKGWVRDIAINKEGTRFVSCGDDGRTLLWNISDIQNASVEKKSFLPFSWITTVDFKDDNLTYLKGGFNGKIKIICPMANYRVRIRKPVNKVLFKPCEGIFIKAAIATSGKGVILIDSKYLSI